MEEETPPSSSSSKLEQNQTHKSSVVIEIPSYQEVLENNQSKSKPPSLFTPSETFSQAFASIKNSEFYIPPPTSSSTHSSNASSSLSSAAPSSSRLISNLRSYKFRVLFLMFKLIVFFPLFLAVID